MSERLEIKAALAIDETGVITGTAWDYSTPDRVGDVIVKGAVGDHTRLPMLFAHDQAQAIGVWESITETDAGLTVKGRLLVDDVVRAREVRALVQAGAVSGLSIGFVSQKATARARGGRTISKLDLHEISIVAVPCHPGATITTMKTATGGAGHEQESNMSTAENIETKDAPAVDQKAFDAMKAQVDALKARADKLEAKANRLPAAANDNAHNDNLDLKAFEAELRQSLLEKKTLTISAPGTVGNLVQDVLSTTILEKVRPASPLRALANVVSVGGPLLQIPRLVNRVAPGSVTEVATKPTSEPSFEQIDVKPFAMGVITPVSRTALEDSAINLVNYLGDHIAAEFATLESQWFVTGNGTTQAEGVLNSSEVEEIENAAITTDALLDIFYGVKSVYSAGASWLMNRKTMRIIRGLKDADGNLIWQPGIQAGQPGQLLGRPVYECDFMPDAEDDETPIIFGDFKRGYLITDRVSFDPFADYNTRFGEDIVVFGGRRRVGGRVVMGEALIKLKVAA